MDSAMFDAVHRFAKHADREPVVNEEELYGP